MIKKVLNILLLSFLFSLLSCSGCREPIIYLIPEGYVGPVFIFYDDPSAPPLAYEDKALVLPISDSGILRTSSPMKEGPAIFQFFYLNSAEQRKIVAEVFYHIKEVSDETATYVYNRKVAKSREWFVVGRWEDKKELGRITKIRLDSLGFLSQRVDSRKSGAK